MMTMHPTLLIGPADWDATRMPREEFFARIAALWKVCDAANEGVIVFGSPRRHAELVWLTHFTPKLEPGLALISREGAPRLFVGGGVNMLPAAMPLTWITELRPLRAAAKAVAGWAQEAGGAARLALVNGDAVPLDLYREITGELSGALPTDITPRVAALMAHKRPRELAAIREACATLDAAATAMEKSWRSGASTVTAVLAAEQAANRRGAQDVRTLFGRGGGRTLMPFAEADTGRVDPLQAYVAVRHRGYWAEGFIALASTPSAALTEARAMMRAAIAAARPGASCRDVGALLAAQGLCAVHDVVARAPVTAMGLALESPDGLGDESLAPDAVYSLRAGIRNAGIVSAMVAMTASGADVLWPRS